MEAKFFKEIVKKMNVKTLNDFEKELRTNINHELEIERKTNEKLVVSQMGVPGHFLYIWLIYALFHI